MKRFLYIFMFLFWALSAYANPFYFAQYGDDANDGLSWNSPKTNFQRFIQTSTVPRTIYFGAGTWYVTNAHLNIPANKALIGTNVNEVILTVASTNIRVINAAGTNVWLEALSITGATNRTANQDGGGVLGQPDTVITNCNIYSNHTSRSGGGVSRATIYNSRIYRNTSVNGAGTHICNVWNSDLIQNYATTLGGGGAYSNYRGCNIISNKVTGGAAFGGGVNLFGGIVSNCMVKYNSSDTLAAARGGGIYCESTTNYIINSEIVGNNTSNGPGGGINIFSGETIITNCIISSNSTKTGATSDGGGVYAILTASTTTVANCYISYNQSYGAGGGVYLGKTYFFNNIVSNNIVNPGVGGGGGCFISPTTYTNIVDSNLFCNNRVQSSSSARGGGIYILESGGIVSNCIIRDNYVSGASVGYGGGISGSGTASYTNTLVINSQIYGNISSNAHGGGVAYASLINCGISNNSLIATTVSGGGGYYVFSANSIFKENSSSGASRPEGSNLSQGSFNCDYLGHTNKLIAPLYLLATAMGANNVVYGNLSDTITGATGYQVSSNYFGDPMFLPDSYKLQQGSPCIDMGNDTYATNVDYYGRGRIYGVHVDIGAAEWYPEDVPVTLSTGKKKALLKYWE